MNIQRSSLFFIQCNYIPLTLFCQYSLSRIFHNMQILRKYRGCIKNSAVIKEKQICVSILRQHYAVFFPGVSAAFRIWVKRFDPFPDPYYFRIKREKSSENQRFSELWCVITPVIIQFGISYLQTGVGARWVKIM